MINIKLVTKLHMYCFLLKYTMSQYNPSMYSGIQEGYHYPYQNVQYAQYSNPRSYKDYENSKWPLQENTNYEEYNDYAEENICSCDKCDQLKPACKAMCPNCVTTPRPVMAPNYVFLPFPYPFPIIANSTIAPTIKTTKTTEVTATLNTTIAILTEPATTNTPEVQTTEAQIVTSSVPEKRDDILREKSPFNLKNKSQYMLTSLRRTKPNWLPKYGIVPISDKFAEKLMLQLRSMKVLHPQKDNIRNIDEITSI